jgi:hypothetical protein
MGNKLVVRIRKVFAGGTSAAADQKSEEKSKVPVSAVPSTEIVSLNSLGNFSVVDNGSNREVSV